MPIALSLPGRPAALLALPSCCLATALAPPAAHHPQHLFSPAIIGLMDARPGGPAAIDADGLVAHLDRAGIRRMARNRRELSWMS